MRKRSSLAGRTGYRNGRGGRGRGRDTGIKVENPYETKRNVKEEKEDDKKDDTGTKNVITQDIIMRETNDRPLETIGSKEWNEIPQIEITITKLKKSMTGMQDKDERNKTPPV